MQQLNPPISVEVSGEGGVTVSPKRVPSDGPGDKVGPSRRALGGVRERGVAAGWSPAVETSGV